MDAGHWQYILSLLGVVVLSLIATKLLFLTLGARPGDDVDETSDVTASGPSADGA